MRLYGRILGNLKQTSISKHWPIVVLSCLTFLAHLLFISLLPTPGLHDGLVYYHVAQSIVDGKGFQLPYIWNYLSDPDSLTPPAFGYWMPLATLITVPGLILFGKSIYGALVPQGGLLVFLSLITYYIVLRSTKSMTLSIVAALLLLFDSKLGFGSGSATPLPTAVVGALSFMFAYMAVSETHGRKKVLRAAVAGVFSGLATLSRGDGLLIMGYTVFLMLVLIVIKNGSAKGAIYLIFLFFLGFIVTVLPWWMRNLYVFGSPFPPGAKKALFAMQYDEIYSLGDTLSLSNYMKHPISELLYVRLKAFGSHMRNTSLYLGVFVPFASIGVLKRNKSLLDIFIVICSAYAVVLLLFYSFVAVEVGKYGALNQSIIVVLPFWIAMFAIGLMEVGSQHSRRAVLASVLLLRIVLGTTAIAGVILARNDMVSRYQLVVDTLKLEKTELGEKELLVMDPLPYLLWEVGKGSIKTIQIPNEDLGTILAVAKYYGVTHIHLSDPNSRPALAPIYWLNKKVNCLTLVASIGSDKIFRLEQEVILDRCISDMEDTP